MYMSNYNQGSRKGYPDFCPEKSKSLTEKPSGGKILIFCLRHSVDLEGHADLLASCVVLVQDTLVDSLVDCNDCCRRSAV